MYIISFFLGVFETSTACLIKSLKQSSFLDELVFWTIIFEFPQKLVCLLLNMMPDLNYKVISIYLFHCPLLYLSLSIVIMVVSVWLLVKVIFCFFWKGKIKCNKIFIIYLKGVYKIIPQLSRTAITKINKL